MVEPSTFHTAGTQEELRAQYASRLAEEPHHSVTDLRGLRAAYRNRRDEIVEVSEDVERTGAPFDRESWFSAFFCFDWQDLELKVAILASAATEEETFEFEALLAARAELRRASRDPKIDPGVLLELRCQLILFAPEIEVLHERPVELQAAALQLRTRYPEFAKAAAGALDRIATAIGTRLRFDRPVPKPRPVHVALADARKVADKSRRPPGRAYRTQPLPRQRSASGNDSVSWLLVLAVAGALGMALSGSGRKAGNRSPPEIPRWEPPRLERYEPPEFDYRPYVPPRKPGLDEETRKLLERLRDPEFRELDEYFRRQEPVPGVDEPATEPEKGGEAEDVPGRSEDAGDR